MALHPQDVFPRVLVAETAVTTAVDPTTSATLIAASTRTGGDNPMVISYKPTARIITTVKVPITSSTTTGQAPETSSSGLILSPILSSIVSDSTPIPAPANTLTTVPSHTTATTTSPSPSLSNQTPKPALSAAATVGLGVSMGILAFLIVAGVLYAVFGRYFKNIGRDKGRDNGRAGPRYKRSEGVAGRRWWKR